MMQPARGRRSESIPVAESDGAMVSETRWRAAQQYERGYWERAANEIVEGSYDKVNFYQWRAADLERRLREAGVQDVTDGSSRVLEIGSGPIGVAAYFPAASRVAVDPLEDFYSRNERLIELRQPDMEYRVGQGEALPVGDGEFDLAIMENCIDHVRDPDAVMQEIRRVLRPNGVLYLTVNCRAVPGYYVHRLLSRLRVDAGHPHTFTAARLRRMVVRHGFEIQRSDEETFTAAWMADLRAPAWKDRMKGVLLVSEFVVSVIGRKR
jgi:SAM-dependent methyltransferase